MKKRGKLISACLALSVLFAAGGALSLSAPVKAADGALSVTIKMNGGFRITSRDVADRNGKTDDNRSTAEYSEGDLLVTEWNGAALTKGTELEFTYDNIQQLFPYGAFEKYTGAVGADGKASDDFMRKGEGQYNSVNNFYITDEGYYCPQLTKFEQFPTALMFGLFEDKNDNGIIDDGEKVYYQGDSLTVESSVTLKCFYDPLFDKDQRFSTHYWESGEKYRDKLVWLTVGTSDTTKTDAYKATDMQPFCYELYGVRSCAFRRLNISAIEFPSTVQVVEPLISNALRKVDKVTGLDNVTSLDTSGNSSVFSRVMADLSTTGDKYTTIVLGEKVGLFKEKSLVTWGKTRWIFTGFDAEKLSKDSGGKTTTPLGMSVQGALTQELSGGNASDFNYFYVPYGATEEWYPTPENTSGYTQTYTGLHYGTSADNIPMREVYRIKFDLNGGKVNGKNKLADEFIDAGSQEVIIGEKVVNAASASNLSLLKASKPADAVKQNSVFVGWEDQFGHIWTDEEWKKGGKNDYDCATITLKAVFKTPVTVSFVTNSAQKIDDYLTYDGGFIKQPELTPVAGKTLDGWYTSDSFEAKWDFEADVAGTENITLYAKWNAAVYSVYLYDEVGSIGEEFVAEGEGKNMRFTLTYSYGDSLTLPQSECEGYEFNGWFADDDNKVESITAEDFGAFYLTAEWQPIYYKINYELNGGKNYYDNPDYYIKANTVELQPAKKTGYSFKGWYLDENFETPIEIIENRTGDITVYAAYEVDESVWFTITYNLNGGKNDDKNVTEFLLRERITLYPAAMSGYTFDGWYEDAEFTTKIESIDTTLQKNYVLYAKFTAVKKVWNITYHLNGGTNATYNAGTYIEGKGLTLYAPTLEGYKFDGWYTDKDFTHKIDGVSETDSGDIEVYAKFIAETKESGCKGALGVENIAVIALCGGIAVVLTKSRKRAGDDK